MSTIKIVMENFDVLKQISAGIYELFGPQCEVVIYDFSDLERSIVHMEGNVSGRSLGVQQLTSCFRKSGRAQPTRMSIITKPRCRMAD